jgi:hypothetical protein
MGNILSKYHSDKYVERRMGETREKGKEYDSTLSCRFGVAECLKLFLRKKLYLLRMSEDNSMTKHFNVFYTIIS